MTVYVEHSTSGRPWSRLWAESPAETRDFAARLDVAAPPPGSANTVISEARRRRAILMGAIPVHTRKPENRIYAAREAHAV